MDIQHAHPPAQPAPHGPRAMLWRVGGWLALAAVLAGVFYLYSRPGFLVMLSDMIWACFGSAS